MSRSPTPPTPGPPPNRSPPRSPPSRKPPSIPPQPNPGRDCKGGVGAGDGPGCVGGVEGVDGTDGLRGAEKEREPRLPLEAPLPTRAAATDARPSTTANRTRTPVVRGRRLMTRPPSAADSYGHEPPPGVVTPVPPGSVRQPPGPHP